MLGNKYSRSSTISEFVLSYNSAIWLLKPFRAAFISAGILKGDLYEYNGYL